MTCLSFPRSSRLVVKSQSCGSSSSKTTPRPRTTWSRACARAATSSTTPPDGPHGLFLADQRDLRRDGRRPHAARARRPARSSRRCARNGNQTPVLFLSALGEVDDRVRGLHAGGDDYLTKPFAFSELLARLEALLRRGAGRAAAQTELQVGDLEMDLLSRTVTRAGREIDLQPREFQLLEYLMRHAGQVVTRTMLLENVWDYHFDPQTNVIDVHISRLRQKIDKDFDDAAAAHRARRRLLSRVRLTRLCSRTLARFRLRAPLLLRCSASRSLAVLALRLLADRSAASTAQTDETIVGRDQRAGRAATRVRACSGLVERHRRAHAAATGVGDGVYLLADRAATTRIAGNLRALAARCRAQDGDGWLELPGRAHASSATPSRTVARAPHLVLAGGFHLLVGRDTRTERTASAALIIRGAGLAACCADARARPGRRRPDEPQRCSAGIEAINRAAERHHAGRPERSACRSRGDRRRVRPPGREPQRHARPDRAADGRHARSVTDNIAHDLRSPLTRLRSRLEMRAACGEATPTAQREAIEAPIGEADGAARHLQRAAVRSPRPRPGRRAPASRRSTSTALAARCRRALRAGGRGEGPDAGRRDRAGPVIVTGNRQLLFQALANLLDNADQVHAARAAASR